MDSSPEKNRISIVFPPPNPQDSSESRKREGIGLGLAVTRLEIMAEWSNFREEDLMARKLDPNHWRFVILEVHLFFGSVSFLGGKIFQKRHGWRLLGAWRCWSWAFGVLMLDVFVVYGGFDSSVREVVQKFDWKKRDDVHWSGGSYLLFAPIAGHLQWLPTYLFE